MRAITVVAAALALQGCVSAQTIAADTDINSARWSAPDRTDDGGWMVGVMANNQTGTGLVMYAYPEYDCRPVMAVIILPVAGPKSSSEIDIRVRVDKKRVHKFTANASVSRLDGGDYMQKVMFAPSNQLIEDLGKTGFIYVDDMIPDGSGRGAQTGRYSMHGLLDRAVEVIDACKKSGRTDWWEQTAPGGEGDVWAM